MTNSDEKIIALATDILFRNLRKAGDVLSSPIMVKQYLALRLAQKEQEIFGVLWLDVKNRLTAIEDLFFGTLAHTSVYPREVVKKALRHNAAAMICYHNHPSGSPEPSEADALITRTLRSALQLVEVRLLDHVIVGGTKTYSFAEHGEL